MKYLLFILLASCDGIIMNVCPTDQWQEIELVDDTVDCKDTLIHGDIAVKTLINSGVTTQDEIDGITQHTRLTVKSSYAFYEGGQLKGGWSKSDPIYGMTIDIGSQQEAIAHELIHLIELNRGILDTSFHHDWDKKGYYGLSDIYAMKIGIGENDSCPPSTPTDEQFASLKNSNYDMIYGGFKDGQYIGYYIDLDVWLAYRKQVIADKMYHCN